MEEYFVYKHTNLKNSKIYIGITNNVNNRWRNNGIAYKPGNGEHSRPFWSAINKYGWGSFKHEILMHGLSFESACHVEKKLISYYKSRDKCFGYNVAEGGNGGAVYDRHPRGMLGKHQTDFQKKYMSDFMKKHNPMEYVHWGVNYEHPKGMLGKKQTKHQKEVASAKGENAFHGRKVCISYPDGNKKYFKTVTLAKDFLGVSPCWMYRQLKSDKPYHMSKNTVNNRNVCEKLNGIFISYIK